MFQDEAIVRMYLRWDVTCDDLVSDPDSLAAFATEYIQETGHHVRPRDLARRLLNLRKRGEDKGGLPRLRRRYNGRGPSGAVSVLPQ